MFIELQFLYINICQQYQKSKESCLRSKPPYLVLCLCVWEHSCVSASELAWLKNSLLLVFIIQLHQCLLLKHIRVGNERSEKDYSILFRWQCWFVLV